MCLYYEWTAVSSEYKAEAKHVILRTRDIPCRKVTVKGKLMCQPVERILWEFDSSSANGPCVKCGM